MNDNRIITGSPIPPEDVDPTEILAALHKRQVDTQKLIAQYRDIVTDLAVEIEMLKNRIDKIESK